MSKGLYSERYRVIKEDSRSLDYGTYELDSFHKWEDRYIDPKAL